MRSLLVIAATVRRNPVYRCGIIPLTLLARPRGCSPQKILHQLGELHPVGDAQKQVSIPHRDFRIWDHKIGPSPRN